MAKRLCTFPGCNAVVDHDCNSRTSPRCPKHTLSSQNPTTSSQNPTTVRKHYDHHYDEQGRNIYKTAKWKRIRKARLLLNPLCQHCERMGLVTEAQHVDHIVEIEDGGDPYDLDNTQSLCISHHNTKTGQEKRKRNHKGKQSDYASLSDFK